MQCVMRRFICVFAEDPFQNTKIWCPNATYYDPNNPSCHFILNHTDVKFGGVTFYVGNKGIPAGIHLDIEASAQCDAGTALVDCGDGSASFQNISGVCTLVEQNPSVANCSKDYSQFTISPTDFPTNPTNASTHRCLHHLMV